MKIKAHISLHSESIKRFEHVLGILKGDIERCKENLTKSGKDSINLAAEKRQNDFRHALSKLSSFTSIPL